MIYFSVDISEGNEDSLVTVNNSPSEQGSLSELKYEEEPAEPKCSEKNP